MFGIHGAEKIFFLTTPHILRLVSKLQSLLYKRIKVGVEHSIYVVILITFCVFKICLAGLD